MAEGIPDGGGFQGYLPLRIACARVYRAVIGRAPQDNAHLDTVAFSLSTVARVYATDPLTKLLFPLAEAELIRGRFHGGGERFLLDGEARYAGLHVALTDLEDAIRLLASARNTAPIDVPPATRP